MKTRSKREALRMHEQHRAHALAKAREIARAQIAAAGFANTRTVRAELLRRGLMIADGPDERWLGAVFVSGEFEPTGETVPVTDGARNIHAGRGCRNWRLKGPAPAQPRPETPLEIEEHDS